MTRYVPVTGGSSTAETLSVALWALHRTPEQLATEATARCFDIVTALDASVWLCCDTELTVPVHESAEIDGIAPILLGAGLPQSEVDVVEAAIIAARGGEMNLWQHFPEIFKNASKSREDMENENLLAP
jgi:hypothetical protein